MPKKKSIIIGVDGNARAGKGTIVESGANLLGYSHFDVGSSFRTFAYLLSKKGITPENFDSKYLDDYELDFTPEGASVNGEILGNEIRSNEIGTLTAHFCNNSPGFKPKIFKRLEDIFKNFKGNLIADGRNLRQLAPNALLFYIAADAKVRARRAYLDELKRDKNTLSTEQNELIRTLERDKGDYDNVETPLLHPTEAFKTSQFVHYMQGEGFGKKHIFEENLSATGPYKHFMDTSNMEPEEQLDIFIDNIKSHYNL